MGKIIKIAWAQLCLEENIKGVELIWGGDFQSFKDYVHFELKFTSLSNQ